MCQFLWAQPWLITLVSSRPASHFFLFLKDFWCGPFNVIIEFVTTFLASAFLFFLCFEFWLQGMGDPSSPTRNLTHSPYTGRQSPNHGTSSGSPGLPFLHLGIFLFQETWLWLGSPFYPFSSLGISIFLLSSFSFLSFSFNLSSCAYPIITFWIFTRQITKLCKYLLSAI